MQQFSKNIICSSFVLLFFCLQLFSQSDSLVGKTESSFGIIIGAGYNKYSTVELALGIQNWSTLKDSMTYNIQTQAFLGSELNFTSGKATYVPKFTMLLGFKNFEKAVLLIPPITSGFSLVYPTNFSEGSFCLRLEYGFPFKQARLYYGYIIPFSSKEFLDGMRHSINFSWFIRSGKKHVTREYYNHETDMYYEISE